MNNHQTEDNEYLNMVDKGYIGLAKPQVHVQKNEDDTPSWVIRKFQWLARQEGMTYYEWVDKYQPSFNPSDWDNDPGSPEQAGW